MIVAEISPLHHAAGSQIDEFLQKSSRCVM
jgi:hypothetical protein